MFFWLSVCGVFSAIGKLTGHFSALNLTYFLKQSYYCSVSRLTYFQDLQNLAYGAVVEESW